MKQLLLIPFLILTLTQCKPTKANKGLTTLKNTHWKLSEINGIPILTPEGSKDVHFILTTEDGQMRLNGFAGCNSISGSYTLSGKNIKFIVASTKMMCSAQQMKIEDFFTSALTSTDSYEIDGDVLELYKGNTSLADFKAIRLK